MLGVRQLAGIAGYDLVRRHYYSPVPDLTQLPKETWTRTSGLGGLRFDVAGGLEFLQQELAPYIAEYHPPLRPIQGQARFYLANGFYEGVDAETLYAMVRLLRPKRIIELGSGFSTLVIAEARARNGDSSPSAHIAYDPYPRRELEAALREVAAVHDISAAGIPPEAFSELRAGDMLFIDSTHIVKIGSDVNHIMLDVVPDLAPGVYVHFHDIFLPWEYPRNFVIGRRFFFTEQYLLQAFLSFNQEFETLFGNYALARTYPREVAELIPSAAHGPPPSAFWLRRRGQDAS